MKIQRLSIKNIASIEEASIDFENGALADDPLFLITGDTGTGKTTILNAICLALYNDVPSSRTIGTKDDDREGLKTTNPLQLMRKGTTEAHVELRFIGNNGHHYSAKWMASRARKKVTGKLKLERELTDATTQSSFKGRDIDREVPSVVGLTFNQFTRTTMLAQGQFATFMKASDDEKSDILEKLTGTDIYTAIGKKINELSNQKKHDFSVLEEVVKQARLLSDDEKAQRTTELITSNSKIDRCNTRIKTLTAQIQWLNQDAEYRKQLAEFAEAEAKAAAEMEKDTYTTNQDIITEWEDTREVRSWIAQRDSTEQGIATEGERLKSDMQDGLGKILGYQMAIAQSRLEIRKDVDSLSAKIEGAQPWVPIYDNAQRINHLSQAIKGAANRGASYQQEIATLQGQITKANTRQKGLAEKVNQLLGAYNAEKARVKELDTAVRKLNVPALNEKYKETMKLANATEATRANVAAFIGALTNVGEADKTLKEARGELDKTERAILEIESKIPKAKAAWERKDAFLQGQMELADHIASLRKKFAETNTCPLCGSSVETLIGDEPLNDAVQQAGEEAAEAKRALDNLSRERDKLDAMRKVQAREVKSRQKAHTAATKALDEAEERVKESGVDYKADDVMPSLDTRIAELQSQLQDLDQKLKDATAKSGELDQARDSLEAMQEQLDGVQKQLGDAQNDLTKLQGNLTAQEQGREAATKEVEDNLASLERLPQEAGVDTEAWVKLLQEITGEEGLMAETVATLAEQIFTRASEYHQWVDAHSGKSRECTALDQFNDSLGKETAPLLERFPIDLTCVKPESRDIPGIRNALSELKSRVDVTDGKIAQAHNQMNDLDSKIQQWYTHSGITPEEVEAVAKYTEDAVREIQAFNKRLYDAHEDAMGKRKTVEGQIAQLQLSKPEYSSSDTLENLAQELSVVEREKDGAFALHAQAKAALDADAASQQQQRENMDKLEQLRGEKDDWGLLDSMFGTATNVKFRKIAQSYVLRALLVKANYYLSMLTSRYQLDCEDGSLTINVIDRNHGDSVRNVGLLSGGESFIVSLALALGLSAISKEKIHVDTLFIDEGFGTLDKDVLDTVITTLDRLHAMGGRRIGIISHVQDLKDRIPTQIRLVRSGPSSSKVVVATR
ncbi:MAG: AAA family ATPase [Bacteroidales bacterium]|nr:AAA family ATPase [Bacteroidales bacterium]